MAKEGKQDYLMLDLDRVFWQKVKHLAIDMNMNVKQLILYLLQNELDMHDKENRT